MRPTRQSAPPPALLRDSLRWMHGTRDCRPGSIAIVVITSLLTIATTGLAPVVRAQNDTATEAGGDASRWQQMVQADGPSLWWAFDGSEPLFARSADAPVALETRTEGRLETGSPGATPGFSLFRSPLFAADNQAVEFFGSAAAIKIKDPGEASVLDFDAGDALTIEAWVKPEQVVEGRYLHILTKGRTDNAGVPRDNLNYSLRLQRSGGQIGLSFLFRSRNSDGQPPGDYHRWTSSGGFPIDKSWHHVAVTIEFGRSGTVHGYVDGREVPGVWDLGGDTDRAPVVDNDEVWIGSAMGLSAGSTFHGKIDELVVYRKALGPERIQKRALTRNRPDAPPRPETAAPQDEVLVEVIEGVPDQNGWADPLPQPTERWTEPAFAFFDMPQRYSDTAVRVDRSNPLVLRARSRMSLPAGKYQFLLRTLRYGRLFVDGREVLATPVRSHRGGAHGGMYNLISELAPGSRPLYPGAAEKLAEIELDGKPHEFRLEIMVGGQKRRLELGETSLSFALLSDAKAVATATAELKAASANDQAASVSPAISPPTPFRVLSMLRDIPMTDVGWQAYESRRREEYVQLDQQRRFEAGAMEQEYWARRHAEARRIVSVLRPVTVPQPKSTEAVNNDIDRFIVAKLEESGVPPAAIVDDWAFLRRLALDTIGTPPSPEVIAEFFADDPATRRGRAIDRLLEHPGWADHWVGYWQDVLAENPNVVNPTLNNTGPFRWWILESFQDNKPIDRFATELVMMDGSEYFGGPGGFSMATQNDSPFAAKAGIVGQAFLALEMKCARCHDAPYHDFQQSDLFSLAALLNRGPESVPATSTIPGGQSNSELVKVTLKPGEAVQPNWPFADSINGAIVPGQIRNAKDSREELAAHITSPLNERFTQVVANRLWQRYLGRGLAEPVDDWERARTAHPELLRYLGRELAMHGYDLKHVARLIFNSQTWQRQTQPLDDAAHGELFGTRPRRRLTAEQLIDSVFAISGKPFRAGDMNIDVDGSREFKQSLNLGIPQRAWMFSSLSNERDRPSLSLPFAAPFVTTMQTFGWRDSRQNPLTVREEEPTVLQPAVIANGSIGRRFTRLSDDSEFTQMALSDQPVSELVNKVYERAFTRQPTSEERELFMELLSEGYGTRLTGYTGPAPQPLGSRTGVGWSNHLDPAASRLQIATQERVHKGDPPTRRLTPEWRERFEDMLWSMLSSPEFIFVP